MLVQAFAVADLVVGPFQRGADLAALRPTLLVLGGVVLGRGLLAWATEISAHRAAARVKSQLRRQLLEHVARLGPSWLSRQTTGDIATLAARGTDALDAYFARYLPALVAAAIVPPVVVAAITAQDLLAGLPRPRDAAPGAGVRGPRRPGYRAPDPPPVGHPVHARRPLPGRRAGAADLLVFRRAQAQVTAIRRVTEANRRATMATLRLAFLSSAVLELVATLSVALVAVSTGLRLVSGSLDLHTGLVVLVLAPEAYLPLRQVGASSMPAPRVSPRPSASSPSSTRRRGGPPPHAVARTTWPGPRSASRRSP